MVTIWYINKYLKNKNEEYTVINSYMYYWALEIIKSLNWPSLVLMVNQV